MTKKNIFGLILSGGKSTRMGHDKSLIRYHGIPQRQYLYGLLKGLGLQTFLGVRKDQVEELPEGMSFIVDTDEYRGPFNGLLSAHRAHPQVAWLVLACDLPLIDAESLQQLVQQRDPTKTATAFATHKTGLPEPLAAIWEPEGLLQAITYLKTSESSCPRKFLLNSDIKLVFPKDDDVLLNANSEQEYRRVMEILS